MKIDITESESASESGYLQGIKGAAKITDGILGVPDYRITARPSSRIRVEFPQAPKYVRVTPRGTGGVKVAINAPSTATADAWLAQADSNTVNMSHREVVVGDPVEIQEFFDNDGITIVDLLEADATLTRVEVTGV